MNPNVPWKTRGNAALAAQFGRGSGPRRRVGTLPEGPVYAYRRGRPLPRDTEARFVEEAWETVLCSSRLGDPGTDPALVVAPRRLHPELYWRAVRTVVDARAAIEYIARAGGTYRCSGSNRGVVGAAAAVAWPGRRVTWELIAYRGAGRKGTGRKVTRTSVTRAARAFPSLFLCADPRTRRLLVVPHTPCPTLFGLRSTRFRDLRRARLVVRSEPVERWMIFRTNQATGDHVAQPPRPRLAAYESGSVEGRIASAPVGLAGGHVRLELDTGAGAPVPCMVFEPTKTLPPIARSLRPGDRVRVWGGRGGDEHVRAEGLVLLDLRPRYATDARPCDVCAARVRSLGTGRGYRCPRCGARLPPEAGRAVQPPIFGPGTYHPTPSARRHLHPRAPEAFGFAGVTGLETDL